MDIPATRESIRIRRALALVALRACYALAGRIAPQVTSQHALKLLCTPHASSRTRARAADDGGAVRDSLWLDAHRLATYRWGDPSVEPYVLLVHGWSSFALRFLPWVKALRDRGYAVVSFDQPGHGFSDGLQCTLPTIVRALKVMVKIHGPPAALLAHSLGACASMMALAEGMHAAHAILIAPVADPVAVTERFARMVALPPGGLSRLVRALEEDFRMSADEMLARRRLPALSTPALIVHDLWDSKVPWGEGECYGRHWPDARLLTKVGLGHSRIVTDPSVIDAGLRFLQGEAVGERFVPSHNMPNRVA